MQANLFSGDRPNMAHAGSYTSPQQAHLYMPINLMANAAENSAHTTSHHALQETHAVMIADEDEGDGDYEVEDPSIHGVNQIHASVHDEGEFLPEVVVHHMQGHAQHHPYQQGNGTTYFMAPATQIPQQHWTPALNQAQMSQLSSQRARSASRGSTASQTVRALPASAESTPVLDAQQPHSYHHQQAISNNESYPRPITPVWPGEAQDPHANGQAQVNTAQFARSHHIVENHMAPRPPSRSSVSSDHGSSMDAASAQMHAYWHAEASQRHFAAQASSPLVAGFTVAPGSLGGSGIGSRPGFNTPPSKKTYSDIDSIPSSSTSKLHTPSTAAREDTPTSSYSAGESTYQPSNATDSAERRMAYQSSPTGGSRRVNLMVNDDEDGSPLDGSRRRLYPQSSPLCGRKSNPGPMTSLKSGGSKGRSKAAGGAGSSSHLTTSNSNSSIGGERKRPSKESKGTPSTIAKEEYVPEGVPPGPRSSDKPHFSYAALIGQAINACPRKRLALSQIYAWINAAYPFFKKGDAGWMNSIRHNLSLNDCFVKSDRKDEDAAGKGSVWMIADGCEHMFANGGFKKVPRGRNEKEPVPLQHSPHLQHPDLLQQKKSIILSSDMQMSASSPIPPSAKPPYLSSPMPGHASPSIPFAGAPMSSPMIGQKRKIGEVAIPLIPVQSRAIQNDAKRSRPALTQAESNKYLPATNPAQTSVAETHKPAETGPTAPAAIHGNARSVMPPPHFARPIRVDSGPGIMEVEDLSAVDAEHHTKLRLLPSSSPAQSLAPTSLKTQPLSQEAGSPLMAHIQPSTFLQEVHLRRASEMVPPQDDFSTPNRQVKMPSYLADLPHLTPSASSPVSSPAPPTIRRPTGAGVIRDSVKIRSLDFDASDSTGSQEDEAKAFEGKAVSQAGLAPSVEFLVLPKSSSTTPGTETAPPLAREKIILSPIRKRVLHDEKNINLPGPSSLLQSPPRLPVAHNKQGQTAAGSTDRPSSPTRTAKMANELFMTPLSKEPSTRLRSLNSPRTAKTPSSSTPMRSSNAIHHMFSETPVALTKMQYMAEHGLLESPMGLSGSCYDVSNTEYCVDWELEHIQAQSQCSPTRGSSTAKPKHQRMASISLIGSY